MRQEQGAATRQGPNILSLIGLRPGGRPTPKHFPASGLRAQLAGLPQNRRRVLSGREDLGPRWP